MTKTIKISEENYLWLLGIASQLQKKLNYSITLNDTLNEIKKKSSYSGNLSSLAGGWKIAESKAEKMKKEIKQGWKKWKIKSV